MDIDDRGHVQQILKTNCESPNFAFTLRIMYLGLSVYIFKQIFFSKRFSLRHVKMPLEQKYKIKY